MPLLSQINVITHHVLGIASYNQKEKKKKKNLSREKTKKKKKLSREKTADQDSG